ncbi:MAG: helix-hairpin-helix domain-containing protein [Candidatus Tectomicrobia bacterium]|uniref:Helix-hairpin-helix domain-containing protein n=1 Tax=Tectimicrobiota bacterium TaxID=2528274 RepID=A0A932GQ36_UNCTE|nr:helix-hairpin-helix domain-containing protein [Candidatus Tectomicrobia bacterium]
MKRFSIPRIVSAAGLFILWIISPEILWSQEARGQILQGQLNINQASEMDFLRLPGVGEVTARRIVSYRQRVGGFKSIFELRQVKGVSSSLIQRISPYLTLAGDSTLKRLVDLNQAPVTTLSTLPNISPKKARTIASWRKVNGGFHRVEDLLLVGVLSPSEFEELRDWVLVGPIPLPRTPSPTAKP